MKSSCNEGPEDKKRRETSHWQQGTVWRVMYWIHQLAYYFILSTYVKLIENIHNVSRKIITKIFITGHLLYNKRIILTSIEWLLEPSKYTNALSVFKMLIYYLLRQLSAVRITYELNKIKNHDTMNNLKFKRVVWASSPLFFGGQNSTFKLSFCIFLSKCLTLFCVLSVLYATVAQMVSVFTTQLFPS